MMRVNLIRNRQRIRLDHARRVAAQRAGLSTIAIVLAGFGAGYWMGQNSKEGWSPFSTLSQVASRSPEFLQLPDSILKTWSDRWSEPTAQETVEVQDQLITPSAVETTDIQRLEFDKERVLSDVESRIADVFTISDEFRPRVSFWFDVYTKYDEHQRVIHHSRYPWIVFKVVDVTDIIFASEPRRRWMRNERADKHVAAELARVRKLLRQLSLKKNLNHLSEEERELVEALTPLGGRVQTQARLALSDVRVQTGQRNFFEEGLKISPRYLPAMEEIFRKHKLPIELTRLPFVESSFNKFATSKDGAAGIWQFIGDTGSKFMLVSERIDERRSPFKATEAAAKLLKENHMILHRSWPLALTAYNHGPRGIREAVRATKTKDIAIIANRYRTKMFGFASANFYASFLAAMHAQMYHDVIWSNIPVEPSLDTHMVRLPRAYRINQLLSALEIERETLILHNPDLRKVIESNGVVPKGFRLHLPSDLRQRVEGSFARLDRPSRRGT